MEEAIKDFLLKQKEKRIKGKTKTNMNSDEAAAVKEDAEAEFAIENWLPHAAERAGQLSMSSHMAKFSHPDAKTSIVLTSASEEPDGFLRTGNIPSVFDVSGNAAALDVNSFLSLRLSDGRTILEHLEEGEEGSELIQKEFNLKNTPFHELRENFLKIRNKDETEVYTDERVKQVYFPTGDGGYHLLSLLTSSGLIFKLKEEINNIRFPGEEVKERRKHRAENTFSKEGYSEIFDITTIGYGGAQPQNISVLNSKNKNAHLLRSLPPVLQKRKITFPKTNFFYDTLWVKNFSREFHTLHRIMLRSDNNKDLRDKRDDIFRDIIDKITESVWTLRLTKEGWSDSENFVNLPLHQKIWLDDAKKEERNQGEEWSEEIFKEMAHWIAESYKRVLKEDAFLLSDEDLLHIRNLIKEDKEALL